MNNNEQIGKQDMSKPSTKLSKRQIAIIGEAFLDMSQMQEKLHYLNVQLLQNVGTASLMPELKQLFVSLLTGVEEEARQLRKCLAPQDSSKPGVMDESSEQDAVSRLKESLKEPLAPEISQTEGCCTSQQGGTMNTADLPMSSVTTISVIKKWCENEIERLKVYMNGPTVYYSSYYEE